MTKQKKRLLNFFKTSFSILGIFIFVLLVYKIGLNKIYIDLRIIGYKILLLIPIALGWHLINSIAWHLLLKRSQLHCSFFKVFINKWAAESLNAILPLGNMGGEAFRVIMLSNQTSKEHSLSNVIHDRILHYGGSFLFIALGSILGIIYIDIIPFKSKIFMLSSLFLLISLIIVFKNFVKKYLFNLKIASIQKYLDAISNDLFNSKKKTTYMVLALNFFGRLLGSLEFYLILNLLGNPLSLPICILFSSFLTVLNFVFFIVPGGIGILEGGQVAFTAWLGLPPSLGMSVAIIRRLRHLLISILGIFLVPFVPELNPIKNKLTEINPLIISQNQE